MGNLDWGPWFDEIIDAYMAAIEAAAVDWATNADGEPWVFFGGKRPPGNWPYAMVLRFQPRLDEQSRRETELWRIDTDVTVVRKGDPMDAEANQRQAVRDMAAIMTALYEDRTLGGACQKVTFQQMGTLGLENADGESEAAGTLQLQITKEAKQPR